MSNYNCLFSLHGMIQTIAVFALLTGLYYAIKRPSGWFPKHRAWMFTFAVVATIGAFVSLYAVEHRKQTPSSLSKCHGIIGMSLLLCIFLQLTWAIVIRRHIQPELYLKVHRILAYTIVLLASVSVYLGFQNWKALRSS